MDEKSLQRTTSGKGSEVSVNAQSYGAAPSGGRTTAFGVIGGLLVQATCGIPLDITPSLANMFEHAIARCPTLAAIADGKKPKKSERKWECPDCGRHHLLARKQCKCGYRSNF